VPPFSSKTSFTPTFSPNKVQSILVIKSLFFGVVKKFRCRAYLVRNVIVSLLKSMGSMARKKVDATGLSFLTLLMSCGQTFLTVSSFRDGVLAIGSSFIGSGLFVGVGSLIGAGLGVGATACSCITGVVSIFLGVMGCASCLGSGVV